VLVTRESPLSLIHIENMRRVTEAGAVVLPPVLTTYSKPETVDDLVDHITGKVLDALRIDGEVQKRWK
jgi:4-hydroxy-3-polyprenylbenzoate decarboxylase